MDRAARVHPHAQPLARLQPTRRQRTQQRQFFLEPLPPARVELLEQPTQEGLVGRSVGKVPAATQQEGLVQGTLELPVTLFHVAVLVGMSRLDGLALQTVVPQQRLVTLRERRRTFRSRRDGRRQPVRAVQQRHAAQLPERVLKSLTEAFVALGKTDRARLPIGVGEHEVVDQVIEGHTGNGYAQIGAVGEVAGAQPSGMVDLGKEHLPGWSLEGTPLLDASLQGPQLAVGETSGKAALQVNEQSFSLQSRVDAELVFQLRPDLGERIGSCAVVAVHASHLAGQFAEPAVLARRLGIDAGLVGGALLGQSAQVESAQAAHLLISDHPEPPAGRVLDSVGPERQREI
jgi:hypothetical protein